MKILKISGKNLASLAGEFTVDFRLEPLVSAGLFAISGPTGAGKSTLLDALCLALYDATPRLLRAGNRGIGLPDVGTEKVTPHDTRNLLRRGTAEGFAEVEFFGNDAVAYRARWSVRRARSKAGGALQKVDMSLIRLSDMQAIGGTKSEVEAEIEQRIGLSFDQFTRAVLLAQNEFSAFLKADDSERGELLETLTGTAVYTEISKRAHERNKIEQAALLRLNELLAGQKALEPEARAQLDADCAQAVSHVTALEQQKATLDAHLRWHQALDASRKSEQLADIEVDRLLADQQAAIPRRVAFARVESVQAARPLLADADRIDHDIEQARRVIASSQAELDKANLARQTAELALEGANRAVQDAEQAQRQATPQLDNAKALDAQLNALQPAHQQAGQANRDSQTAATQAQQALAERRQQHQHATGSLQEATDWLQHHAGLKPLADDWPRWDVLLVQAAQIARDCADLDRRSAVARQTEASCRQQQQEAAHARQTAELALAEAQARRTEASDRLAQFDRSALQACRLDAETRRDLLSGAEQAWRTMSANQLLQSELVGKARQQDQSIVQAQTALAKLEQAMPSAQAALQQAERSLKAAEAACGESVEKLRAALETDAPCPVCGALDHPYRTDDPQLRNMLAALQAELARCRAALQELVRAQATQAALESGSRAQHDALVQQLNQLEHTLQANQQAWNAQAVAAELDAIAADSRADWFVSQQLALKQQLQSITEEDSAAHAAAQAADLAQKVLDAAANQFGSRNDAAVTAQVALTQAATDLATRALRHAEAQRQLDHTLSSLDGAFGEPDWRADWHAAPEAFHGKCKAEAEQWQQQFRAAEDSRKLLGQLDVAIEAQAAAHAKADAERQRAADAFAVSIARIEALQVARRALFDGKPADQVAAALNQTTDGAKALQGNRMQAAGACATTQTRCAEALEQARLRLAEHTAAAAVTQEKLAAWLDRFNAISAADDSGTVLDSGQLRTLLTHSQEWILAERKDLQAIEERLQNTRTIQQERRTQRDALELQRPTQDAVETVQQALEALIGARQETGKRASELQLAQAQDELRRSQSAAMLVQIEQQAGTTRVWAQMSELIGSADGKKFRNFAQQFTLDVLLGYANRHLAELSRRYRLERIGDTLALMVLDQDMGDEMRSVHSLSGGESFLVSLALALGLASLSSNRVRVESLFIDEGFGSLDADTLSVAMDALDGLQALGRKVGVISHVQEMTERIATKILVQRSAGGKSQVVIV